jgi:uncharacterized protein (DUF1330 family)
MKTRYIAALSMLAGAALGATAIQGLQAQAKPPAYYIGEIEVTNPDGYAKKFLPKVQPIIKTSGGRYLAAAGAASGAKVTAFDGEPPKRVSLIIFDSMDKLQAWRNNPEYVEARKIGEKYAKFRSFALEGVPQ